MKREALNLVAVTEQNLLVFWRNEVRQSGGFVNVLDDFEVLMICVFRIKQLLDDMSPFH